MLKNVFWNLHSLAYDIKIDSHVHRNLQSYIIESLNLNSTDVLLDAGCGTGALELALYKSEKTVKRIIALDKSKQMLNKAKKNLAHSTLNIKFVNADLEKKLPIKESSVKKIACSNVLYNLKSPEKTLKEFFRILKPRGILVFTEPKPTAQGKEIAKEHFSHLNLIQKFISFFKSMLIILPFEAIIKLIRQERAYFFEKESIDSTLKKIGFKKWTVEEAYANQNWLVKATR